MTEQSKDDQQKPTRKRLRQLIAQDIDDRLTAMYDEIFMQGVTVKPRGDFYEQNQIKLVD